MGYAIAFVLGLLTTPALLLLSLVALGIRAAWRKAGEKPKTSVTLDGTNLTGDQRFRRWGNN